MSFLSAYRKQVKQGALLHDPMQERVAQKLDDFDLYRRARKREEEIAYWPCVFCCLARMVFLRFKKPDNTMNGLYIHGPVGRGKSHLMDMYFEYCDEDRKRRVHFHEFMKDVHDFIHHQRGKGVDPDAALERLCDETAKRCRLLCFDEFHVTDIADALILSRLFTGFFERGVFAIMTSNTAPDDLYKNGIQRDRFLPFIELIKKKMVVCAMTGDTDFRLEQLRGHRVYFYPVTRTHVQEMDRLYDDMIAHSNEESLALSVKGHALAVPRAAGRVARFTFEQLCERAYGAQDYLALAKQFDVIFIDKIPVIAPDNTDIARRVIVMIDALYEQKVRLVVTAEAPPEGLYPKGPLKGEFERTASRLYEMQSYEYLE